MEEVYKTTPVETAFANPFAAFGAMMLNASAPEAASKVNEAFVNVVKNPVEPEPTSDVQIELAITAKNTKEEL